MPARTVRQAIQAHGRDAVNEVFVQLIHDAVETTGLPEQEAFWADIDGMVKHIGKAVMANFPGEFR